MLFWSVTNYGNCNQHAQINNNCHNNCYFIFSTTFTLKVRFAPPNIWSGYGVAYMHC